VFGEITPKTLAQRHAQWIAARVAPVLFILDWVLWNLLPVNRVLGLLTRALSRGEPIELPVTEDDLVFMARLAHRHAHLPGDARLMIERVLRFQRALAKEVMVPRPRVVTVDRSWDLAGVHETILESGHSRFPVVAGAPDDIVGVLLAKHLLQLAPQRSWTEVVVSPLFIPEGKSLPSLLHDFRTSGQHLAIVLDEFGGFAGVVSLEDALELLVGEIADEFDQQGEDAVIRVEGGWSVPGHLSLRRLEVLLHRGIDQPAEIDSVGGLATHILGDNLALGATADWDDLRLEVETTEDGRAARVAVKPNPSGADRSPP